MMITKYGQVNNENKTDRQSLTGNALDVFLL